MKREDNLKGKGFDSRPENINRKGRPRKVSIKNELEKILQSSGTVTYKGDDIVKVWEDDKGVKHVTVKQTTQDQLARKMLKIAMGSSSRASTLKAITQIMEQFDGKPKQSLDVVQREEEVIPQEFGELPEELQEAIANHYQGIHD